MKWAHREHTAIRESPAGSAESSQCMHVFALEWHRKNLYHTPNMVSRFCIIAVCVCCLYPTFQCLGQDSFYAPNEGTTRNEPNWNNPYPGLGNVAPSPNDPFAAIHSARPLYPNCTDYTELTPTIKSSELYLARIPNNKRTGMFQKLNFNTLWVPGSGSDSLGMTELDISAMFGLPLPTKESPLLITPKFSTTFLDSPSAGNETFYTTGLSFRWLRPIAANKLMLDFGVNVLYSGDFAVSKSDAMRYPMHIAGIWNFNPRTKIILGIIYSDRKYHDNWIPMAGIIWTPNEDVSVELVVPRIRIAQRIRWFGSAAGNDQSDWIYSAFELGTNSWEYEPIEGRVEYRDLRILSGYERRTRFGATIGIEAGYMFDREINNFGKKHPANSMFLRLRTSF